MMGFHSCQGSDNNATGSQEQKQEHLQDLVVVEQCDTIHFDLPNDDGTCFVSFKVDVPANGPQILVDSVVAFINNELYDMFATHLPFDTKANSKEDMITKDGQQLLHHYMEKFREPLTKYYGYMYQSFELKLVSQTEKFVTFDLKLFGHNGMHFSSQRFYYTFAKNDGHQVKGIVDLENLQRFFDNHSGQYDSSLKDAPKDFSCGLLDNHVALVYPYYTGTTELTDSLPYSQILPYLSPEAQKLVGKGR